MRFIFLLTLATILTAHSARAEQCEPWLNHYESHHTIPNGLLHAIGRTESGRYDRTARQWRIWPWTVHTQGQGYYFDNRQEALDFIETTIASGTSNIDIGCMQINYHYHKDGFASVQEMLSPERNIAYASKYLKAQLGSDGQWHSAIGAYHSYTAELADGYRTRVLKNWRSITANQSITEPTRAMLVATLDPKHARVRQFVEGDVWSRPSATPAPQPTTTDDISALEPSTETKAEPSHYAVARIAHPPYEAEQKTMPSPQSVRMIFD